MARKIFARTLLSEFARNGKHPKEVARNQIAQTTLHTLENLPEKI